MNETIIKDMLENTAFNGGASDEYVQGIAVGLTAGIMAAKGYSFNEAWALVRKFLPRNHRPNFAPGSWLVGGQ